jgi:hypothetical protein
VRKHSGWGWLALRDAGVGLVATALILTVSLLSFRAIPRSQQVESALTYFVVVTVINTLNAWWRARKSAP